MQSLAIIRAGCRKGRCKSRTKCPHPIQRSPSADQDLKSGFQICVTLPEGGRTPITPLHATTDLVRGLRVFIWIAAIWCARAAERLAAVVAKEIGAGWGVLGSDF